MNQISNLARQQCMMCMLAGGRGKVCVITQLSLVITHVGIMNRQGVV